MADKWKAGVAPTERFGGDSPGRGNTSESHHATTTSAVNTTVAEDLGTQHKPAPRDRPILSNEPLQTRFRRKE
jgi:hypothetical protein